MRTLSPPMRKHSRVDARTRSPAWGPSVEKSGPSGASAALTPGIGAAVSSASAPVPRASGAAGGRAALAACMGKPSGWLQAVASFAFATAGRVAACDRVAAAVRC
eukprot:365469-Chlamydomonas_euryale.AAC.25